jgi:hypothetical protein
VGACVGTVVAVGSGVGTPGVLAVVGPVVGAAIGVGPDVATVWTGALVGLGSCVCSIVGRGRDGAAVLPFAGVAEGSVGTGVLVPDWQAVRIAKTNIKVGNQNLFPRINILSNHFGLQAMSERVASDQASYLTEIHVRFL